MADEAHESIVISGDAATIMGVIADFDHYPQWAGPVKRAEVLESDADGRPHRVRLDVELMGFGDSYVNEYVWDGDRKVTWTMREGRSQKSQVGAYTLEPEAAGRTRVRYDLTVEAAIPIPGLIRRRIQSKIVDSALKDLKKRVEG